MPIYYLKILTVSLRSAYVSSTSSNYTNAEVTATNRNRFIDLG